MASDALSAVHEHLAALNTHDKARISETVTYPFFQGLPNGAKYMYRDAVAYPQADPNQPAMTLTACKEVARSTDGEMVVFDVVVDQAADGNAHHRPRQALYCVARVEGEWKTVWRQFLGYL